MDENFPGAIDIKLDKKRRLPSIIDAFVELCRPGTSPLNLCEWAGIWLVNTSVERRVHIFTKGRPFPINLFIILVSPSGYGKSYAIDEAYDIVLKAFGPQSVSPQNMSAAALSDLIRDRPITWFPDDKSNAVMYHGCNLNISDLQTLLPIWDTDITGRLTRLYDCNTYSEGRRAAKVEDERNFFLPRVWCSMLAGTTPQHINTVVDETAWEYGMMAQTTLVYNPEMRVTPMRPKGLNEAKQEQLKMDIIHDLRWNAHHIKGRFEFDDDCYELMEAFNMNGPYGGEPIPKHPRQLKGATRRPSLLNKLMTNCAVDRGELENSIKVPDYQRAYKMLVEAEATVPDIFKEISSGTDASITDEVLFQLRTEFGRRMRKAEEAGKHPKPFSESYIIQLLARRIHSFRIEGLIQTMENAGYLIRVTHRPNGKIIKPSEGKFYRPAIETDFEGDLAEVDDDEDGE